ncbi:MAG: hypothetical protein L6Q66_07370, partial [Bacteroidia bacterium]|nr:hypothetical protein [Bacteroidia bacterium]
RVKNWDSTELIEPIDWNTITPQYSYWYYIKFHYSDTNEDVYTWIREEDDPSFTILALDGLSTHIDSLTPITGINMDWKNINRDYNWYANKREISKFENRIVDLIKEKIRSRQ